MQKPCGRIRIINTGLSKEVSIYSLFPVLDKGKGNIGDSQTMAAEAGVLGVPFIRYNDFVGRIGYLNDIENKYGLGFGIKPNNQELLLKKINELINTENLKSIFQAKRTKMLNDKTDASGFLYWFIKNYPQSYKAMKENPAAQYSLPAFE